MVIGEKMDMFCDKVRVLSVQEAMEKIEAEGRVRSSGKGLYRKKSAGSILS